MPDQMPYAISNFSIVGLSVFTPPPSLCIILIEVLSRSHRANQVRLIILIKTLLPGTVTPGDALFIASKGIELLNTGAVMDGILATIAIADRCVFSGCKILPAHGAAKFPFHGFAGDMDFIAELVVLLCHCGFLGLV